MVMVQQQQQPEEVIVKLYLSKEHIRRFTIPKSASFEDLKIKIVQFYGEVGMDQIVGNPTTTGSQEEFDLQYCDDDNEWTVLRNEDDWYCCKAICPTNIKIRKPSMWMKAQLTYLCNQQAVIQTFNKEKKYLIEKSKEIFSKVNEECQKLGSNQQVKKIETAIGSAVSDFIETVTPLLKTATNTTIETVTPLLKTATNTTCEFISSVESSLKNAKSSTGEQQPLIRVDESAAEEPLVDEEEDEIIAKHTVQQQQA